MTPDLQTELLKHLPVSHQPVSFHERQAARLRRKLAAENDPKPERQLRIFYVFVALLSMRLRSISGDNV